MLLSKKISKLRRKTLQRQNAPKNPERIKEPKKNQRCQFVHIPLPTKFLYSHQIYLLYGDLPIMEYNGKLVCDVSFYNEFKLYQEVVIGEMYNQKVTVVKAIPRQDREFPHWSNLVTKLKNSEDPDLQGWGKSIQVYSQKYSKVMSRQSRKKSKSEPRRKFFADVTTKTEEIKRELFQEFPCLQLKFRLKKHENHLAEIIFNEDFVHELGYTPETFAMSVQQEGIPQLISYENANSQEFLRVLIDKYFFIENDGHRLPEAEGLLILKGDFLKDIKYQVFFLMNYETNTFGMDVILAITAKGESYLRPKTSCIYLNKDFLENRIIQEEEASNLLTVYYNLFIQHKYMNQHRTCTIRELNYSDDDEDNGETIIVKKDEEI